MGCPELVEPLIRAVHVIGKFSTNEDYFRRWCRAVALGWISFVIGPELGSILAYYRMQLLYIIGDVAVCNRILRAIGCLWRSH